jgi:hypothetical protein
VSCNRGCCGVGSLCTGGLRTCVKEVAEPVGPQALLAQSFVEALHMGALSWFAWLDVVQLDLPLQALGPYRGTLILCKLRDFVRGGFCAKPMDTYPHVPHSKNLLQIPQIVFGFVGSISNT